MPVREIFVHAVHDASCPPLMAGARKHVRLHRHRPDDKAIQGAHVWAIELSRRVHFSRVRKSGPAVLVQYGVAVLELAVAKRSSHVAPRLVLRSLAIRAAEILEGYFFLPYRSDVEAQRVLDLLESVLLSCRDYGRVQLLFLLLLFLVPYVAAKISFR